MIELKLFFDSRFSCPNCGHENVLNKIVFLNIRILASCKCIKCELEYFNDLPVGHALNIPFKIEKGSNKIHGEKKYKWFADSLSHAFISEPILISIQKKVFKEGFQDVIILNCLDYLYGHVLLKLFNTQFYLDKFSDKGIILILPTSFEWLIPEGIAEAWLVDVKLSQARRELKGLDEFVQKELLRFNKVFLSPVYSHPYLKDVEVSKYSKVTPFSLNEFYSKDPVITFIYREDRLWHSGQLEYFIFLVLRKLKLLSYLKWLFHGIQIRRIVSMFKKVRKEFPSAQFYVAGLGEFGSFPSFIKDNRKIKITDKVEKEWCELYAQSHLVVGIHGSNMLLPSAHSAGFVELLPDDRIGNITQDLFCKYESRDMLFLGRFVEGYASPGKVSLHICRIIKGWKAFNLYSSKKNLIYDEMKDVSKYQLKDF